MKSCRRSSTKPGFNMKTTKTSKPKFLNVAYVANKPRVSLFQDLVFQLGYCVIPAGYLHISQLHVCSFCLFLVQIFNRPTSYKVTCLCGTLSLDRETKPNCHYVNILMNIKVIRGTSASECNHIFISEELRVKVMFVVQVKELTAELLMPQLKI